MPTCMPTPCVMKPPCCPWRWWSRWWCCCGMVWCRVGYSARLCFELVFACVSLCSCCVFACFGSIYRDLVYTGSTDLAAAIARTYLWFDLGARYSRDGNGIHTRMYSVGDGSVFRHSEFDCTLGSSDRAQEYRELPTQEAHMHWLSSATPAILVAEEGTQNSSYAARLVRTRSVPSTQFRRLNSDNELVQRWCGCCHRDTVAAVRLPLLRARHGRGTGAAGTRGYD